ncbi:MAG: hypothetical protein IK100_11710 [Muribaculaceae bacterium]|nr:hypothetical protein [Muribaculaceae bacterium]
MKKFLLLAAFFAAFTMSAQQFTLTEVTSTNNVPTDRLNNRQGFGMDGKFVVMDKVLGEINFYAAEDGVVENTLYTGATASWPAITRDEAGNIIARVDNSWPGNFMADTVVMKIFPAGGGEAIDVECNIFADFEAENGRCDFFSFIEGNVMDEDEGGILWLVTAKSTGILKVPFLGGEIDADHIALFPVEGATLAPTSSTVVNPYIAVDGTKHYMLWTRNAAAVDLVMNDTEDGFIGTSFTLPNKGATNGCFPLTFGGKDLVIYTMLPNYGNAWAIAEKNAEEAIAVVEEVPGFVTNGFQCNWLNAEVVSENKAIIYQYFPGNFFKTYELTIGEEELEINEAYLVGTFNDWNQTEEGGRVAFEDVDGVLTASGVELEAGAEFKVIVPNGENWTWLGGEDANGVGYFLFTGDLMDVPVQLVDGANFRMENAGTYDFEILPSQLEKAASYALRVTESEPNAIETVATDKVDNTWYNLQGVQFNGMPSVPGIYINNGKKVIIK